MSVVKEQAGPWVNNDRRYASGHVAAIVGRSALEWYWDAYAPDHDDSGIDGTGSAATEAEAKATADAWLREFGHLPAIEQPTAPAAAADPVAKPRWSLLPWAAVAEVVALYTRAGQGKHATEHWRSMTVDEHLDAVQRHIVAHRIGDTVDPEYGFMHLVHAAARLLYAVAVATRTHNPPAAKAGTGE